MKSKKKPYRDFSIIIPEKEQTLEQRLNKMPSHRTFQQIVTQTQNKHLIRRPFVKPIIGTIDQLDIIAYGKNKKPLMLTKIQRRKPNPVVLRAVPLRKNPNKINIFRYGKTMFGLSVFAYKNNNAYIYICNHGSFVDIPTEAAKSMCEAILKYLEKEGLNL